MGFNSGFKGLINVLCVNIQEFSASSWRSNQAYTRMHGQPIIKLDGTVSIIVLWSDSTHSTVYVYTHI